MIATVPKRAMREQEGRGVHVGESDYMDTGCRSEDHPCVGAGKRGVSSPLSLEAVLRGLEDSHRGRRRRRRRR